MLLVFLFVCKLLARLNLFKSLYIVYIADIVKLSEYLFRKVIVFQSIFLFILRDCYSRAQRYASTLHITGSVVIYMPSVLLQVHRLYT